MKMTIKGLELRLASPNIRRIKPTKGRKVIMKAQANIKKRFVDTQFQNRGKLYYHN